MASIRRLSLIVCVLAAVAQTPKVGGDYSGTLGPVHLKLHLKVTASGAPERSLDSVDQGARLAQSAALRQPATRGLPQVVEFDADHPATWRERVRWFPGD